MKTISDILRDADPLRGEPRQSDEQRERVRRAVLAAASGVATPSSGPRRVLRIRVALLAAVVLAVAGIAAIGSKMWSGGGATLHAAVRFEVRLAESGPAAGLREVRIAGSDRVVYLHADVVVNNDDVAQSRVIQGDRPSRFGVAVTFNTGGAEKMRQATASHVGKPLAILIDGDVVAAPVVRTAISTSAVLSGDFTQAEADRIVNGIGVR